MGYRAQAISINASRAVYALNWFNIAPGLQYISRDLDLTIVQLGIMTTAFYIGLSVFQLAGGLLASRIGNRATASLGITILGAAVIGTGFSQNLPDLFASRLFAGMGSALFFSPALGMISEIVPQDKYSFHVGLFNGSFNLGGGIGIIGWNFLDQAFSWRIPLFLSGGIMIALAAENYIILRGARTNTFGTKVFSRAGEVLRSRLVWILPIAALSGILSETVIGQLFVYYAETGLHMSPDIASTLGTTYLIIGFVGGMVGGYIFGKTKRRILMFLAWSLMVGAFTAVIWVTSSFILLFILLVLLGILTVNVLSMLYTLTAEGTRDRGMVSFALSFVNFVQNIIGSFSPLLFSLVYDHSNYTFSWITIGTIGVACVSAGYLSLGYLRSEIYGRQPFFNTDSR
ncbi:MAG: MFS transporter [Thermoplasmataceae archaeon]